MALSPDDSTVEVKAGDVPAPSGRLRGLARGASIGRFIVLDELGAGGMGVVYEAMDPELERKVAIKVVTPDIDRDARVRFRERLIREARAIAKLAHPNVVGVYDVGEYEDALFIAMELVRGVTLKAWLEAEPRTWQAIVRLFTDAGRGLAAGHAAGIVHRDFKPTNVLVGDDGRVRVIDFGLAGSAARGEMEPAATVRVNVPASSATATGTVLGTPLFMAPEQMRGEVADARSDQFAFCVTLYRALFGRAPFAGDSLTELSESVERGVPPPVDGDVPAWLGQLVRRGLARDPDARFPSMDALLAELTRDRGRGRRWATIAAGGALVAAGSAVAAFVLAGGDGDSPAASPCAQAGRRGAEVWSADAQATFTRAVADDEARPRAHQALDRWVDRWRAARVATCEATHVTRAQSEALLDLRMACLDRRLDDVGALVVLFATTPAGSMRGEQALRAAMAMPSLAPCDDAEALRAVAPLPTDDAARAAIADVRTRIARAGALQRTEQYVAGVDEAKAAVAAAAQLDYAPAYAEALLQLGSVQENAGDAEGALATLRKVTEEAARAGDVRLAAQSATVELGTVGYRLRRTQEALALVPAARAAVVRAGDPPDLRGGLANVIGLVHLGGGDFAAAITELDVAIEQLGAAYGAEDLRVIQARGNRGIALERSGRAPEAITEFTAVRDGYARILGPRHSRVGAATMSLGLALDAQGRADEALVAYREALANVEAALGPEHPDVASALVNLASSPKIDGEEELALNERALVIRRKTFGDKHARTAASLSGVGGAYYTLEQWDKASEYYERALAMYEATLGPEHTELASLLSNIGILANRRGDFRRALEVCTRALALDRKVLGDGHAALSFSFTCNGIAHLGLGKARVALAELEKAAALQSDSTPGAGEIPTTALAKTRFALARALVATGGDLSRADKLVADARAAYVAEGTAATDVAEIDAWLAKR